MTLPKPSFDALIAGGLLTGMVVLMAASTLRKTHSYDEGTHLTYSRQLLAGQPMRVEGKQDATMPINVPNALSAAAFEGVLGFIPAGRLATILATVILGIYVFLWSRALYGPWGARLSLALFVASPSFLAHGALITTDVWMALFTTASLYHFWRADGATEPRRRLTSAAVFGASLLTKYTALLLVPIFGAVALARHWRALRSGPQRGPTWCAAGRATLLYAASALVFLNVGFLFAGTFTPLAGYTFNSSLLQSLQGMWGVSAIPLPVPVPFLQGIDMLLSVQNHAPPYLLGEWSREGFASYYLFTHLLKEPLGSQALLLLALYTLARHRERFWSRELFVLGPALLLAVYFSFFHRAHQIGIRHVLAVYPLLYVACGVLAQKRERWWRGLVAGLLVATLASTLSAFPNYVAYFNELVGPGRAYRYLADSNLDWGQNDHVAAAYIERHPEARLLATPRTHDGGPVIEGQLVLSVTMRLGLGPSVFAVEWVASHLEPSGHLGAGTYLVYDIPRATGEALLRDSIQHTYGPGLSGNTVSLARDVILARARGHAYDLPSREALREWLRGAQASPATVARALAELE